MEMDKDARRKWKSQIVGIYNIIKYHKVGMGVV
jgi:hypothetical protein